MITKILHRHLREAGLCTHFDRRIGIIVKCVQCSCVVSVVDGYISVWPIRGSRSLNRQTDWRFTPTNIIKFDLLDPASIDNLIAHLRELDTKATHA